MADWLNSNWPPAVLAAVREERRRLKEEAWVEGHSAGMVDYASADRGITTYLTPNPYAADL